MNKLCDFCKNKAFNPSGHYSQCNVAEYYPEEGVKGYKKGANCIHDGDLSDLFKPVSHITKSEKKLEAELLKLQARIAEIEAGALKEGTKAKDAKIEKLLVAYGNATFACGSYLDDDEDTGDGYNNLLKNVEEAKAALIDAIGSCVVKPHTTITLSVAEVIRMNIELKKNLKTILNRMRIDCNYSAKLSVEYDSAALQDAIKLCDEFHLEAEAHAALQARCFDNGSQSVFDRVIEMDNAMNLIIHLTQPLPDDGSYHENAYSVAMAAMRKPV